MEVLLWLTVLVAGLLWWATKSGLPRGVWKFWGVSYFSYLGGAPTKPGGSWVLCYAPAGAVWPCSASLFLVKVRHSGKKMEVTSARFANIWVLGDFLSNSGKRCRNVLFTEIMNKPITWCLAGFLFSWVRVCMCVYMCVCLCIGIYMNIYCAHTYIFIYFTYVCILNTHREACVCIQFCVSSERSAKLTKWPFGSKAGNFGYSPAGAEASSSFS